MDRDNRGVLHHKLKHIWQTAREYLTHWMVAGLIVAATGVAPEHWMAHLVQGLHIPTDALHLWAAEIDLRWLLLAAGLTLVVGDIAWRRTRPAEPTPAAAALALPDKPSIAVLPFDNLRRRAKTTESREVATARKFCDGDSGADEYFLDSQNDRHIRDSRTVHGG